MDRFAPAQVYDQRKHLVDQEMADSLDRGVATGIATDYLASGAVNDEVGDIGEGKYVTIRGLAVAKPNPAAWRPRTQIPSGIEADALKATAKIRANR